MSLPLILPFEAFLPSSFLLTQKRGRGGLGQGPPGLYNPPTTYTPTCESALYPYSGPGSLLSNLWVEGTGVRGREAPSGHVDKRAFDPS